MNNFRYKLVSPKNIQKIPVVEEVKNDYVVIKPTYLSICAADIRYYFGLRDIKILNNKLPLCLIHEGIGIVQRSRSPYFNKGDNVILYPNVINNHVKNENYDVNAKFMSSSIDGFMQENVVINSSNLIKIKNNFKELELMVISEVLSVVIHAIESNKNIFKEIKKVALFGDGNLSYLCHLYLLKKFPNLEIFIYGVNEDKLNIFSKKVKCINSMKEKIYPMDVAIEMVGGQSCENIINSIIDNINPVGTIFLLGVSENKIPINTRMVLEKGLSLIGRSRSQKSDFIKAKNFIYNNKDDIRKVISEIISVNSIEDIHRSFNKSIVNNFKTIMKWNL